MTLCFFDDSTRPSFFPLSFTRPIADIRFGIRSIAETWSDILSSPFTFHSSEALNAIFPSKPSQEQLCINGRLIPDFRHISDLRSLKTGECLVHKGQIVAAVISPEKLFDDSVDLVEVESESEFHFVNRLPDFFAFNDQAIQTDFELITRNRVSAALDPTLTVIGNPELVFIEAGAQVEASFLNTRKGPIYIGSDATVMEASVIHGPFSLGDHATIKAGSKIYGATSIGPWCKVGGEVSNSIFQSYSNKGHDGFLGNSMVGEWCNFGADTNTSNLKNNYGEVKTWDYSSKGYRGTGLTFCGLIMGDHSKCGINTMFNTGTTVGVSANIFGGGFPDKFIPSWSWGGSEGWAEYDFDKSMQTAERMMDRRDVFMSAAEKQLLHDLFEFTSGFRS